MILKKLLTMSFNKTTNLYEEILGSDWGNQIDIPSHFVKESWDKIIRSNKSSNSANGTLFEYLIALCLYSKKILPFYMQASMAFVPNAIYDIVLYRSDGGPITLSLKSSLRERYKQADLEGWALKNVHRNALNYLVTLNEQEANQVSSKISKGDLTGLDKVIVATSMEFNELLLELKSYSYSENTKINVIQNGRLIKQVIPTERQVDVLQEIPQ